MQNIYDIIVKFQPYLILGLIVIIIILLILIAVLFRSTSNIEKRYRKFMRGVNNKNIEELIIGYMDKVDEANKNTLEMKQLFEKLDLRVKDCVQKVAMMRYKAFDDVGSDLSFSIALLNDKNDGVVITGIYGRNESTTYAKPIDKGISRYDLSEEELHVLAEAMNK